MNPRCMPPQSIPLQGDMTLHGCRGGSSGELHQRCCEHPQRQHHNEQQDHHKRLPFRLRRQACACRCPAAQAPTLLGSQGGLAERAKLVWQSLGVGDGRRRSAHALASPRGGRKICVGASSSIRSGVLGSEAGGEAAGWGSAGVVEDGLTATAEVAVGLAATGGAVGLSAGAEDTAGSGSAAGVGDGAGVEDAAGAGVVATGGVATGGCTGAGAACAWGATGAVEIGRSALASNDSPQPGQKRSSLP